MFESPKSLLEVCIDFICNNVLDLCDVHLGDTEEYSSNSLDTTTCSKCLFYLFEKIFFQLSCLLYIFYFILK